MISYILQFLSSKSEKLLKESRLERNSKSIKHVFIFTIIIIQIYKDKKEKRRTDTRSANEILLRVRY